MQQDQIKGMLDRALAVLVTMGLGWLVKKGYLGESDAATFAPAIVLLPSVFYGAWTNRNKALVQSAANVPGTIVVTQPAIANSIPSNAVQASNEVNVVQK